MTKNNTEIHETAILETAINSPETKALLAIKGGVSRLKEVEVRDTAVRVGIGQDICYYLDLANGKKQLSMFRKNVTKLFLQANVNESDVSRCIRLYRIQDWLKANGEVEKGLDLCLTQWSLFRTVQPLLTQLVFNDQGDDIKPDYTAACKLVRLLLTGNRSDCKTFIDSYKIEVVLTDEQKLNALKSAVTESFAEVPLPSRPSVLESLSKAVIPSDRETFTDNLGEVIFEMVKQLSTTDVKSLSDAVFEYLVEREEIEAKSKAEDDASDQQQTEQTQQVAQL